MREGGVRSASLRSLPPCDPPRRQHGRVACWPASSQPAPRYLRPCSCLLRLFSWTLGTVAGVPLARHRVALAALSLLGAAVVAAASPAAADRRPSSPLRAQQAQLLTREQRALYALYVQDAALTRARAALAAQQRRARALHEQARVLAHEVGAARRSLGSARSALAAQVTAWYKSSPAPVDPVQ